MKKLAILLALPLMLFAGCNSTKINLGDVAKFLTKQENLETLLGVANAVMQNVNAKQDQSVMIGNTKVTPQGTNPGFQFNYGGAQRYDNGEVVVVFELVNSTQQTYSNLTLANSSTGGREYAYALDATGNSYAAPEVFLVDKREPSIVTLGKVAPGTEVLAAIFLKDVPKNVNSIPVVNLGTYVTGPDGKVYNFSYKLENVEIE